MEVSAIPDPRTLGGDAAAPADAALYSLVERGLASANARDAERFDAQVRDELAARLRGDGAALERLLAGAPSVDVARALWRALDAAWRAATPGDDAVAFTIFAIAIVVVAAGARNPGAVAGTLADPAALAALLREHGALRGNETVALADALVLPDAVDAGRLAELLAWREARPAERVRAVTPAPMPYAEGRESVHARVALGTALAAPGIDLLEREPRRGWALAFTRALARQLAVADATVLAMPAPPASPLRAAQKARIAQRDVAAQLFASNALRALRSRSGEPIAIVSAHRAADAPGGGELRVSLSSPLDPRDGEGFRCPLYPTERAADVARMLVSLMRDCRVADVRVLAGVHADRVERSSQLRLFRPDTPSGALGPH